MTPFQAHKIPQRPASLIWRETDDGLVIVSPEQGQIRVLNAVGAFIWQTMDGQHTLDQIRHALQQKYAHVPFNQIEADLQQFLTDLQQRHLIIWQ